MQTVHNIKAKENTRKKLRESATPQEIILWSRLRRNQLGHRFRRQHSVGKYIVDFYCSEKKLVVELDGWQHREENNDGYDIERTEFLQSLGYKVLRFWNDEVNKNIEGVILKIEEFL
ncbi:MAG: endonuclease domain-containing protein [Candidatus Moranbacteria bacterium]|nr:endonuclease domain-containing protein [Candidatus Moranbacteria bacterium]